MKAVVYNKKISPSKLEYCELDKPQESDDEVLIQTISTSGNAADYRSIKLGMVPPSKVYGSAISGKVISVGKNVSRFKVDDEVLGDVSDFGFGGFAEYLTAPEKALTLKPSQISFDEAACLPVAATTAMKGLRDIGKIQEGYEVLIVGSSGAVGCFAIQLAKHYGAHVTGVCSTRNVEQSQNLGADKTIDYKKEDFTKTSDRYDIILAINGSYSLRDYKRLLKPSGRYVMIGGSFVQIFKSIILGRFMSFGSKKMLTLAAKSDPADLEYVANLMAEGKIKAVIEKFYSLKDTPEAITYLSEGHARSKVIIQVLKKEVD